MRAGGVRIPELTYVELVEALFRTLPPTLIMTALFLGTGVLAELRAHDTPLLVLLVLGAIASVVRIGVLLHGRDAIHDVEDAAGAWVLERNFAAGYIPFGLILGLFCARMTAAGDADLRTLAAVLVIGYSAGVAAGVYVRPWIAISSILLAVLPLVLVTMRAVETPERLLGLVLLAFTAGGIESCLSRYRAEASKIALRHKVTGLSRIDELTSLPNRMALSEEYDAALARGDADQTVWLHVIALDGLQAVNLDHGYNVGDQLVRAAAQRLADTVGDTAFPARLSGGRFAVLQAQPRHSSLAEALSARIARALSQPFDIDGRSMAAAARLGLCRAGRGKDVDDLLRTAEAGAAAIHLRHEGTASPTEA